MNIWDIIICIDITIVTLIAKIKYNMNVLLFWKLFYTYILAEVSLEAGAQWLLEFQEWLYDLLTYLSSDSGESFSSIRKRRPYYAIYGYWVADYPPVDQVIPNYENLTPEERMDVEQNIEDWKGFRKVVLVSALIFVAFLPFLE
jgi:hypothetical protein